MQALPCQDAPKGLWEVWVGTVGVGGTPGNGVWWWQMGHCRSSPLPRLCGSSSSPPSPAQHPGPDHSCCLTWKRNSREAPTRFSRCHLKHGLAFGKSNQSRVTVRFSCAATESAGMRFVNICSGSFLCVLLDCLELGRAGEGSPRVLRCARRRSVARGGGNITALLPGALTFVG